MADDFADAAAAYARAAGDAEYCRGEWVAAGQPVIQVNDNGLAGVHPLLKALHECEALAHRFRAELGLTPRSAKAVVARAPGRPVGAVSADDRAAPPRVKLRSVADQQ